MGVIELEGVGLGDLLIVFVLVVDGSADMEAVVPTAAVDVVEGVPVPVPEGATEGDAKVVVEAVGDGVPLPVPDGAAALPVAVPATELSGRADDVELHVNAATELSGRVDDVELHVDATLAVALHEASGGRVAVPFTPVPLMKGEGRAVREGSTSDIVLLKGSVSETFARSVRIESYASAMSIGRNRVPKKPRYLRVWGVGGISVSRTHAAAANTAASLENDDRIGR